MSFVARETMANRSDFSGRKRLEFVGTVAVVENFAATATAKHIAHAKER